MITAKQLVYLLCGVMLLVAASAAPDSAGDVPLPGPGLVYGGIPYGSMSGNVAEFFKRHATSSGGSENYARLSDSEPNFTPIEQWL